MIGCKSNGEEESIKQWVHWYPVITLLGIHGNEDKFDKDEHIRIFAMVLFISIKRLVHYLESCNIDVSIDGLL